MQKDFMIIMQGEYILLILTKIPNLMLKCIKQLNSMKLSANYPS